MSSITVTVLMRLLRAVPYLMQDCLCKQMQDDEPVLSSLVQPRKYQQRSRSTHHQPQIVLRTEK